MYYEEEMLIINLSRISENCKRAFKVPNAEKKKLNVVICDRTLQVLRFVLRKHDIQILNHTHSSNLHNLCKNNNTDIFPYEHLSVYICV